ncbi:hypothetical protein Tco_1226228 [Tanacetum coccineum]
MNVTVETTETKAFVAQDGLGYDWSDQAEEGPTNFAFMAYTSSVSTSSSSSSQLNVGAYKAGLEYVEARLDLYKKNEVVFEEDIKILKLDIKLRDNALTDLRNKFKKAEKERDDLKLTLEKFENSSKNLSKLLDSQVYDKFKTGVGFDSQVFDSQENDMYKTSEGYHVVPPPYIRNFILLKSDLVLLDEDEYVFSEFNNLINDCDCYEKKMVEKPVWNNVRRVNHQNSQRITHPHLKRNFVPRAFLLKSGLKTLNTARQNSSRATISVNTARPINTAYPKPIVNYARPASNFFNRAHSHVRRPFNMFTSIKNSNFNEKVNIVKGNVTTIGPKAVVSDEANAVKASASRIAGKEIIGQWMLLALCLEKSLPSQIMKKLMVDLLPLEILKEVESLVKVKSVQILNENQVLLRVPRKDNMYSVDLKNIVPSGGLTCLFTKATLDESNL